MNNNQLIIIVIAIIVAACIIAGGVVFAFNKTADQVNASANVTANNTTNITTNLTEDSSSNTQHRYCPHCGADLTIYGDCYCDAVHKYNLEHGYDKEGNVKIDDVKQQDESNYYT